MFNRDPYDDFVEYDRQQEAELKKMPVCTCCGEHIYEYVYEISGETLCEECLNESYRRPVEDYID